MWSYLGDPSDSDKDAIRFMVGDTHEDSPLATDEEIEWCLVQGGGDLYSSAAYVARSISAYFATLAESTEIGPIKITYGKRADTYEKKAADFESRSSTTQNLDIYCGGIDQGDKDFNAMNPSLVSPFFGRGMMDFPYGSNPMLKTDE